MTADEYRAPFGEEKKTYNFKVAMDTQSYACTKILNYILYIGDLCESQAVKNIHRNQQSSYANNQIK